MFYIIYKTTNISNEKYYYGKHATDKIDDGYLGSGILIKAAVRKYGRASFVREIISFHLTIDEMNAAEASIITPEMLTDPQCYNLAKGGAGNHPFKNRTHLSRIPKIRRLIDKNGVIVEGRLSDIAWATMIPVKKLHDVAAGRRATYRGYRAA